jgi:TatD DNase family protein
MGNIQKPYFLFYLLFECQENFVMMLISLFIDESMFTDTHSHIHFVKDYPDVDAVIERAEAADVDRQVIIGCTFEDSLKALEFVKFHAEKKMWCALGVHPHNANECTGQVLSEFRRIASSEKKVVALGEIGLDYFRNLQPKEVQHKAFREQLLLAKELGLVSVVHIRDAWDDAVKILAETEVSKVILHCFSGGLKEAEYAWKRGFYTAFSGVLTYPKNDALREVARVAPKELILIETDCPFLAPQVYRGKRNEPSYVIETAKVLAQVRGVNLPEMAEQTTQNALRIFGIS